MPGLPESSPEWGYFLDVDGTLVELAETPASIRVEAGLLEVLAGLKRATDGAVALVSGRSLADLEARFGNLALQMAGQHGLERRCERGLWLHPPLARGEGGVVEQLRPVVARHAGLVLEDKGLSVALHYRQAPRLAGYVHRLARDVVARHGGRLCLQKGKRVVEIRPCHCDKDSAIRAFLGGAPFRGRRPVFIGDDVTDERGFAEVNRLGGISIKVGRGRSLARFRLPDVAAVLAWLAVAAAMPEEGGGRREERAAALGSDQ